MDGMTQFPNQPLTPEPRPSGQPIYTPPPMLPELPKPPEGGRDLPGPSAGIPVRDLGTKKRIWPRVLLLVFVAVVLILSFLVYYGAPVPGEISDLGANPDLANIGSELNQVEINNLDSELKDIDKELQ